MSSCANIKQFTYDACEGNIGGVKKVWVANYIDNPVSYVDDSDTGSTAGVITGWTNAASAATWYEYNFRKNTASMTSTLNVNDNGSSYVSTELNLVFSRMAADKRAAIVALVLSDAMAIVEDCNGNRWFLGETNPVNVSAGTGETGTAKADNNAYSVTLTDDNDRFPRQLSSDVTFNIASKE
jgi:hypothetical protein